MEDTLISFKTAKLARKKGFKEPCLAYINIFKDITFNESSDWQIKERQSLMGCNAPENTFISKTVSSQGLFQSVNSKETLEPSIWDLPTQSLLQKWLREKHNIIVLIELKDSSMSLYTPITIYIASKTTMMIAHLPKSFDSYEDALETGLIEGLKHIK